MPVFLNLPADTILQALGMSDYLLKEAVSQGMEFKSTAGGIKVMQNGVVASSIAIDAGTQSAIAEAVKAGVAPNAPEMPALAAATSTLAKQLALLLKGEPLSAILAPSAKSANLSMTGPAMQLLKAAAAKAAQVPSGVMKAPPMGTAPSTMPGPSDPAPVPKKPPVTKKIAPNTVVMPSPIGGMMSSMFDLEQLKTADLIGLAEAKEMYRPVRGSSPGSRYYVVGLGEGLNVAARFSSGDLALRIEGSNLTAFSPRLELNGFTVYSTKGYASMHLKVVDLVLARKTVGAVLSGLQIGVWTPAPIIDLIAGK